MISRLINIFKKSNRGASNSVPVSLCPGKLPEHIAIIMDGNGRWAEKRKLPRTLGHKQGVQALKRTIKSCQDIGIKYLSVYAFSTENWKRDKREVDFLMGLLKESIIEELEKFSPDNQIKMRFIGRKDQLNPQLREYMRKAEEKSAGGHGLQLNIMLNYGGRAEIIDTVKSIINSGEKEITEETISRHLYTSGIPDPDLLIRTSGELRISNFMLWQIAYSELYITSKLWPDFHESDLIEAITDYKKRNRRFGKEK
ncbi:MAG: isoprenyl transferase [Candidatus Margulisiibacteriota bacterium]